MNDQQLTSLKYTLHPKVAFRAVAGEIFLVSDDRAFHHAHLPTAIDALKALRMAPQSEDDLVALVTHRYSVDATTARADIRGFLQILRDRMIVVATETLE